VILASLVKLLPFQKKTIDEVPRFFGSERFLMVSDQHLELNGNDINMNN
jgi:hypothetical protein